MRANPQRFEPLGQEGEFSRVQAAVGVEGTGPLNEALYLKHAAALRSSAQPRNES